MIFFATYDTATGRILQSGMAHHLPTLSAHVSVEVADLVDDAAFYFVEGALTARPALPDAPETLATTETWDEAGIPVGTELVIRTAEGGVAATHVVGEDGVSIRFDDPGAWEVLALPPFPWRTRAYAFAVTA